MDCHTGPLFVYRYIHGEDIHGQKFVQNAAMFIRVDVLRPRKPKSSQIGRFSLVLASTEQ